MLFNVTAYTYNQYLPHCLQLTLEEVSKDTRHSFGGGEGEAKVHWESLPIGERGVVQQGRETIIVERVA